MSTFDPYAKREQVLMAKVSAYLSADGWDLFPEPLVTLLGRTVSPDLVAVKDGVTMVVEGKCSMNRWLVGQTTRWIGEVNAAVAAIYEPKSHGRRWHLDERDLREAGAGLWFVTAGSGEIRPVIQHVVNRDINPANLLAQMTPVQQRLAVASGSKAGPRVRKDRYDQIRDYLAMVYPHQPTMRDIQTQSGCDMDKCGWAAFFKDVKGGTCPGIQHVDHRRTEYKLTTEYVSSARPRGST